MWTSQHKAAAVRDTQHLHINVPPAPSTLQRKALIWVLFPAPWRGSRVTQPLFTLLSPGNISVALDRKAGGGEGAGTGLETLWEPGSVEG